VFNIYALADLLISVEQRKQDLLFLNSFISESAQIMKGTYEYIVHCDEPLQLIVFNFIEYLTSTLCINLHLVTLCSTTVIISLLLPCT
jgi:hypothetical protein